VPGKHQATGNPDGPEPIWFQHSLCPKPPIIAYTTDASEANDLVSSLRGDVFGFDLEWPPAGTKITTINSQGKAETIWPGRSWDPVAGKYKFTTGKTAMIQICDKRLVILIHMKDMRGESLSTSNLVELKLMADLPEKVLELIQDPKKFKLGVNISGPFLDHLESNVITRSDRNRRREEAIEGLPPPSDSYHFPT
jgi:hypothetical protein